MMRGRLSIQECCTHTVVVERALPPPYCTSLPLPAAARSQSPLSFNLLMPLQNDSISLQISGVKSGPIWSESTENRCYHIQGHSKSSYGRTILCLTSQTRHVWWCVCTGKMHFHDLQSATLCQSVCVHQKFHYSFFLFPAGSPYKICTTEKTTPCDTIINYLFPSISINRSCARQ
jgi:hypothetical protein